MKKRSLLFLLAAASANFALAAPTRPNIVFILADDYGLDGMGCYGSDTHKTPHLDALATSGTRFQTCYATPLCGPTRALVLTGRYGFRTGGVSNQSWLKGGPGPRAADEASLARLLKQSGYVTAQAGKWRQLPETPGDWGFDEYITDPTSAGWFWKNTHFKNGAEFIAPEGSYAPDVQQDFCLDFIRRHRDRPFFLYYPIHFTHGPILRTPDSAADADGKEAQLYDDNIRYMDKLIGALVAEIAKQGLREKTLIVFSGDNGTTLQASSTIGGRRLDGNKSKMTEGGSRVPFIASWPGVTPAGRVLGDLVSLADPLPTFVELAGGKLPAGVKIDGRSIAPQLRGEHGRPREWAFVQLKDKWFVREPGFKLTERGDLFDMSDAPFSEKLIAPKADTAQSNAARARLSAVLAELNPAAGKVDPADVKKPKGARKESKVSAAAQTPSPATPPPATPAAK